MTEDQLIDLKSQIRVQRCLLKNSLRANLLHLAKREKEFEMIKIINIEVDNLFSELEIKLINL